MNEEIKPLKIFVGWDSREDIAYQACRQSILDHATVPVEIIPLKLKSLIKRGIYTRPVDALASTEFTFTRFLIPELCNFTGWALFVDCDFIFLEDIKNLFEQINNKFALMCVHHDYEPKEGSKKMDGKVQHVYPRKNWSSCMLFNCGHPSNRCVTADTINDTTLTGKYFHRFSWLDDSEIGSVTHEWNWLVGWYKEPVDGKPKALHYTEGGPWFKEYQDCEYANEYYKAERRYYKGMLNDQREQQENQKRDVDVKMVTVDDLSLSDSKKKLTKLFLQSVYDPDERYYKHKDELTQLKDESMGVKIASLQLDDYKPIGTRDNVYDPYLEHFIAGAGGILGNWNYKDEIKTALVCRGLGGKSQKAMTLAKKAGADFYAIDTGYLQRKGSNKKDYHRITKNELQNTGPVIERPTDRVGLLGYRNFPGARPVGKKILICPPSQKVMKYYGDDSEQWVARTISELKRVTDRPIELRSKPIRSERVTTNTIWDAFADNVYCLVTYNSIAATEAYLFGIPAIALAPNAATNMCNTHLSDIDTSKMIYPNPDSQMAFAAHLSYCQFTAKEMSTGYAWEILNENKSG